MNVALLASFLALQGEPVVNPAEVPAVGTSQSIVRIARTGMYRVAVDSEHGTACTLVDHLRGPFVSSGVVGTSSCALDVLLDKGIYKLRLTSPVADAPTKGAKKKASPMAKVRATAFTDVDVPRLLARGDMSVMPVPVGKQLLRFIEVKGQADVRDEIVINVFGRTAGKVALWRDGMFIEDVPWTRSVVRGASGRPQWRHSVSTTLENGVYAIVAYGAEPQQFTTGRDDDNVMIAYDAAPFSNGLHETVTLPPWGTVELSAPHGQVAVFAERRGKVDADIRVDVKSRKKNSDGSITRDSSAAACTLSPTQPQSGCAVIHGNDEAHSSVVTVSGPAGAVVRLQVVPTGGALSSFVQRTHDIAITLKRGVTDLDVITFPLQPDDPPLACALDRLDDQGRLNGVVALDVPTLSLTAPYKRRMNVEGTSVSLWLNVEKKGLYNITSSRPDTSCDVFTVDHLGARTRISGSDSRCGQHTALAAGLVEVRVSGGRPGIEELNIAQVGLSALGANSATPKSGCTFAGPFGAGRYRVRMSGEWPSVAGVVGNSVTDKTRVFVLDPGRERSVTVEPDTNSAVAVYGDNLTCTGADGVAIAGCRIPSVTSRTTLRLRTTSSKPTLVSVVRDDTATAREQTPYAHTPPALTALSAGKRVGFDISSSKNKSFLVDVQSPGLYRIETDGLLHTSCRVRTATSAALWSGDGNGRGRNCRVEAFLKPGSYRVDVTAGSGSVGRATITLAPQDTFDGGALIAGDERFVQVPAFVPAKHAFSSKGGEANIDVSAQQGTLTCRLDDHDGWPMLVPPHRCAFSEYLDAGRYTLTVLPHSSESNRALRFNVTTPVHELSGERTHTIPLNVKHRVRISDDGKDKFRFTVAGDVEVGVTLTGGMQGRLRKVKGKVVEPEVTALIAPVGMSSFGLSSVRSGDDDDSGSDDEVGEEFFDDSGEEEVPSDDCCGEESEDYDEDYGHDRSWRRVDPATEMRKATVPVPPPALSGQRLKLAAGTYELEAEHARGDVGISYDLAITTRALVVGTTLALQAPAIVDVIAPPAVDGESGLVRIKTRGATDVACRLLDEQGALVAQSSHSGSDWNCALAVPLLPGSVHKLIIDAEVLQPGPVSVEASYLSNKSTGALKDGDAFRVIGKVAAASVQPKAGEVVDVDFVASEGEFSCAAFDADGRVLQREIAVRRCNVLLWGEGQPFTVALWTADRPASIKTSLKSRAVRGRGLFSGDVLDDDAAYELRAARRGRYETANNARCLLKTARGALLPCPDSVSVDPKDGDTVLIAVPRGQKARTKLAELVDTIKDTRNDTRTISAHAHIERSRSDAPSLHLVTVAGRPGAAAAPSCGISDGVVFLEANRCSAVTAETTDSELRVWTRPGGTASVVIDRRAVAVPSTSTPLQDGVILATTRYAAPANPARVIVGTNADATVIALGADGRPRDLCPALSSAKGLARCTLQTNGGAIVVVPASKREGPTTVRFDSIVLETTEVSKRSLPELGRLEHVAVVPAVERLTLAATPKERVVRIEGAVSSCDAAFDDGVRAVGCVFTVPAKRSVVVMVDVDRGAWRAIVASKGRMLSGRFGGIARASTALAPRTAVALRGTTAVSRTITVAAPAAVRVRADSGVCAIAAHEQSQTRLLGAAGMGEGCDLQLLLDKGTHTLTVRPFADVPLRGGVSYATRPVPVLGEGKGPEVTALPGEARFFHISLASNGALGIGIATDADVLDCALLKDNGELLATGCQLFGRYARGRYTLRVTVAPDDPQPRRFSPVVFGTKGAATDVPDSYLREFFSRVTVQQEVR